MLIDYELYELTFGPLTLYLRKATSFSENSHRVSILMRSPLRITAKTALTINIRVIPQSSQQDAVHIPESRMIVRLQRLHLSHLFFTLSETSIKQHLPSNLCSLTEMTEV